VSLRAITGGRIPDHFKSYSMKGILDFDWLKKPYIFVFILLIVISRIPLLDSGFGTDQDAWVIADSAFDIRYSRIYNPSRFPGYPLPEFVNALIIDGGWIATNTLTMILFLVSVVLFLKILRLLNLKNRGLLGLTYAFLPILWINSSNTMDYVWALTFLVATWWFILRKQNALAGLMMGLAIGSRLTSAILIPPFLFLIWMENRQTAKIVLFALVLGVTSIFVYLPLFIKYGLQFILTRYIVEGMNFREIIVASGGAFGFYSILLGILLIILSFPRLFDLIKKKDPTTLFLLFGILSIGLFLVRFPYEIEYLIPAIPFVFVLLTKIGKRGFLVIFCVALLSHTVVTGFTNPNFNGAIKKNFESRNQRIQAAHNLRDSVPEGRSVVVVGWWIPTLKYIIRDDNCRRIPCDVSFHRVSIWDSEEDIQYEFSLSLNELQEFQSGGYKIYYIERERDNVKLRFGYDLKDHHAILLDFSKP